jgi:hypothetical protein
MDGMKKIVTNSNSMNVRRMNSVVIVECAYPKNIGLMVSIYVFGKRNSKMTYSGHQDCMDWSDESFDDVVGYDCFTKTTRIGCDEHICSFKLWSMYQLAR